MKKVLFKRLLKGDLVDLGTFESKFTHEGELLHWGIDCEEFRDGVGSYTVALVKLPDGTVEKVLPENLKFIDNKEENNYLSAIENVKRNLTIKGKLTDEMSIFLDSIKNKCKK